MAFAADTRLHADYLSGADAAQIFSGAGLAGGVTVGALMAEDLLDSTGLAGLHSALFTIGSAAAADNVPVLFIALFVYGAGTATNLQVRYAGADLAHYEGRARAIRTVLVATTVGAVIGPNLVGILGDLADALNIPRLAGPFLFPALRSPAGVQPG